MPFHNKLEASIDGRQAKLLWHLGYQGGQGDIITVPQGFVTDFATVPQLVTWLIPTMGAYSLAAVVHDYLCEQLNGHHKFPELVLAPVNARDTDGIFRRIMREAGVPPVRRWLIWTGVRWGALFNPARREGWLADAPAVLGLSLLALPIVLPASLFVGLGSLLYWLLETIVGWFE